MKKIKKSVRVPNSLGIHVRPSTQLAQLALKFKANITIIKDSLCVNAKSSISLLTLAATQGTILTVVAEGEDAQRAVDEICKLISDGFGET
jgi:phosphotransferase system HPr (HPr) family protein